MTRRVQDRYIPDHDEFVAAEPPSGRIIVIAPTRAACETIELALGLNIETFLEKHHGERVRELARSGKGFGIVAGTGTGKTLAIRPIAEEILGTTGLKVGVVNREREATPETPSWNVVIVTTGIDVAGSRKATYCRPTPSSSTRSTRRRRSSSCASPSESESGADSSGCRRRSIHPSTSAI